MKRTMGVGLICLGMALMSGCSNKTNIPKYTATFIDAAVDGVNYDCGNISDKTKNGGKFTCPTGEKVDFSIGKLKLLTIDPNNTKFRKNSSGEYALFVKDVAPTTVAPKIAAVLLTLDSDGNPDNGITLPKEADKIIEEAVPNVSTINNLDVDTKVTEIRTKAVETTGKDTFQATTTDDATAHLNTVEQEVQQDFPQEVTKITGGEG